jgi:hypothetical protein
VILALLLAANAETAWKIEAMNAAERAQNAPKDAVCERTLATAYILHMTKPDLVHKTGDKADFYHVVLGPSDGKEKPGVVFDLAYVYDRKNGELVGARVTRLPDKWVLAFAEANKIIVSDPTGCIYELDTKNPFAAKAIARK